MTATCAPMAAPLAPPAHGLARASCVLAIFSALLGSTAPSPLYPIYLERLHAGHGTGTVIYAMYTLGTLAALLLSARLGGRIGDLRRVILPGLVITALGALIFARADTLAMLLVGRGLNGVGTGLIAGLATSALYDLAPAGRRAQAAMIATVAFTAGAAGGPLLSSAALAADAAPTVTPFVVIALSASLAFAGLMRADWPQPAENRAGTVTEDTAPELPGRTDVAPYVLGCLAITAAWMLGSQLMAMGSMLAQEVYGVRSAGLAGLIPAIFQISAGAGQALFGRFAPRRPVGLGLAAMAAAQLGLVLAVPGAHGTAMFVLIAGCGLAYGAVFVGGLGLVNAAAAPARRAALVSRFYIVGYLANAVPAMLVGVLSDRLGLAEAFVLFSAALMAVALFSAGFAHRLGRRAPL
ncbi:MFS transporter [Frigidibacter sp. MR17.14]|uniref:MFS transporter n=1 Tax=Frigidibacter sp. MR17.14 TaxID=3126509 RepID=UPI0030131DE3